MRKRVFDVNGPTVSGRRRGGLVQIELMKRLFADDVATSEVERRAKALGALWRRAETGHAVVAGSCACGLPAMHISVAEFELDLLDYLRAKWSAIPSAVRIIDEGCGRISTIISELAHDVRDDLLSATMLDDLEKAIRSFAPDASLYRAQRTA